MAEDCERTSPGLRQAAVLKRDLRTSAFIRAVALLRRCDPYRAFSQHSGPGRLYISLDPGPYFARPRCYLCLGHHCYLCLDQCVTHVFTICVTYVLTPHRS